MGETSSLDRILRRTGEVEVQQEETFVQFQARQKKIVSERRAGEEKRVASRVISRLERQKTISKEQAEQLRIGTPVFENRELVGFDVSQPTPQTRIAEQQVVRAAQQTPVKTQPEAFARPTTEGLFVELQATGEVGKQVFVRTEEGEFKGIDEEVSPELRREIEAGTIRPITKIRKKRVGVFAELQETGLLGEEVFLKTDEGLFKPTGQIIPEQIKGRVEKGLIRAIPFVPPPSTIGISTIQPVGRIGRAARELKTGFVGGFSLDPIVGQRVKTTGTGLEAVGFVGGFTTALASFRIGEFGGGLIRKIPVVGRATTFVGRVAVSPPAIAFFTLQAGKEFIAAPDKARAGALLLRDIALFGGAIKGLGVKPFKLPITTEKVKIPTTGKIGEAEVLIGGEKVRADIIGEKDVSFRTVGIEVGTRGIPLVTRTPEGFKIGIPKITEKIPIRELTRPIAQPETPAAGRVLLEILEVTPAERARVGFAVGASRILGRDIGLKPKQIVFPVEKLRRPAEAGALIESFVVEEGGVFFGSIITQRLPQGLVSKKIGDVDIFIEKLGVGDIQPRLEALTKSLRGVGERVKFEPEKLAIVFEEGGKLLEVKSGVDQLSLGLDDVAPSRFLGFDVAETKGVRFGKAEGITAGQQFLRKGAGALIISPPAPAEFPSFEAGGIIGKIVSENARGTKDIAGFLQTGLGLIELRKGQVNPLSKFKAGLAEKELKGFFESFSKEQQADLVTKIEGITQVDLGQRIKLSPEASVIKLGKPPSLADFNVNILRSEVSLDVSKLPKVDISVSALQKPSKLPLSDISDSFISVSDISGVSKSISSGMSKSVSPSVSVSPSSLTSKVSDFSEVSFVSEIPSSLSPSVSSLSSISRISGASSIGISLSPPPPPPSIRFGKPSKRMDLFNVLIGKPENVVFKEIRGVSLQTAISQAKKGVLGTAAASFKIFTEEDKELTKEQFKRVELSLGRRFRASKLDPLRVVQKREFRIETLGEVQDITRKGLAAIKRRTKKLF